MAGATLLCAPTPKNWTRTHEPRHFFLTFSIFYLYIFPHFPPLCLHCAYFPALRPAASPWFVPDPCARPVQQVNIVSNSSSAATPNGQPANGRVAPQPASNGASRPPGDAHSEPPDRDDHGSSRKRRTDRDDQADDRGANRDRSRSDRKRARRRDYHSASASASSWEHERRRKEGERDRDRDRDRDGRRGGEYEREAAYQRQRRDSRRHRHRSGPR
ncbi:unnamed protein product [Ostreobium quekettii]|uniref:Uncharacterized protein n=1 Tax=Ostreobium quekettii TaxID=121088 RepID=A0A8S1IVL2_9CHLO|nr:unnamed protein product [Ostreobium quekettii]